MDYSKIICERCGNHGPERYCPDCPVYVADEELVKQLKTMTAMWKGLREELVKVRTAHSDALLRLFQCEKERQLSVGHSSQNTTERYDRARDAAKNAPGQVFADLVTK